MLRWRLLLGTLIIAMLVGLCWLDHLAEVHNPAMRGICLLPVAIAFALMVSREVLHLAEAGGIRPVPWAVYCSNLLLVGSNWVPLVCCHGTERSPLVAPVAWLWFAVTVGAPLFALAVGVLLIFVGEMRRYERPGGVTTNVAAAVFALVYVGGMLSLVVQLRMWGIWAVASLLIVVKMGDTGAYTIGRLFGRHKMAPVLSPSKTIEGAIGALLFACLGSWATFHWLSSPAREGGGFGPSWGWILFGLLVGAAGVLGDLAESLLKRDVGRKDSSSWLPGFGGVLDMLDSTLMAAPVAWFCWASGLVGR